MSLGLRHGICARTRLWLNNSQLFTIDLDTGAASLVGTIGTPGLTLTGLAAVATKEPAIVPEPASLLLLNIGGLGLFAVIRRRRARQT